MPTLTLQGPAIPRGAHNIVLRDVILHTPEDRLITSSYHVVTVGVREGEFTTWIGEWDQSAQNAFAGEPLSILDDDRENMRLLSEQTLVVKVESVGTPDTIQGSRVNFRLARVGGRTGPVKPLVAVGDRAPVEVRVLQRQINTGGLSEWEDSVPLRDPSNQIAHGTFQGRIQRDDSTTLSLQRYSGCWVEVNGAAIAIPSDGIEVTTSDELLTSAGRVGSSTPSSSTLYYVYVGREDLRLCATAPTAFLGHYYLGTSEGSLDWRFAGWVYLDGSTQFTDSETAREVVNYYHRSPARLYTCPAYADGDSATTYTQSSGNYAKVNSGTGSDVSFIANGEDVVRLDAAMFATLSGAGTWAAAIGIDGATDIIGAQPCTHASTDYTSVSVPAVYSTGTAARHTASLLGRQSAGTATIYADGARNGADADPPLTYLTGWVMT